MHNPYFVALGAMVLNNILGISAYIAVITATVICVVVPMIISKLVIRRVKLLPAVMLGR